MSDELFKQFDPAVHVPGWWWVHGVAQSAKDAQCALVLGDRLLLNLITIPLDCPCFLFGKRIPGNADLAAMEQKAAAFSAAVADSVDDEKRLEEAVAKACPAIRLGSYESEPHTAKSGVDAAIECIEVLGRDAAALRELEGMVRDRRVGGIAICENPDKSIRIEWYGDGTTLWEGPTLADAVHAAKGGEK